MAESTDVIDSILNSTKKSLGMAPEYDAFDPDIILFINGVFSTLHQLGIGPEDGFAIEGDAETWDTFLGSNAKRYNSVKTYMHLKVRYIFDPPSNAFVMTAMQQQITELEWRLNLLRENDMFTTQIVTNVPEPRLDGGSASD